MNGGFFFKGRSSLLVQAVLHWRHIIVCVSALLRSWKPFVCNTCAWFIQPFHNPHRPAVAPWVSVTTAQIRLAPPLWLSATPFAQGIRMRHNLGWHEITVRDFPHNLFSFVIHYKALTAQEMKKHKYWMVGTHNVIIIIILMRVTVHNSLAVDGFVCLFVFSVVVLW